MSAQVQTICWRCGARDAGDPCAACGTILEERNRLKLADDACGPGVVTLDAERFESVSIREHTWQPKDLLVEADADAIQPTILGLFYPTMRHGVTGETESLKTWLALVAAADEIAKGHNVLWLDFEMGGRQTLLRLRALGLTDDQISAHFTYLEPTEAIGEAGIRADVEQLLDERRPTLACVDAYEGASALHGLDPNASQDVEAFYRAIVDLLRSRDAAVLVIDHVPKAKDNRGKFAIGSQRKVSILDTHLGVEVIQPFGRGRTGKAKIVTHKDRPGFLPRPKAAELELRSDAVTGRVTWTLTHAENTADDDDTVFRPTNLMEKASRYLELLTEPASRNSVQGAVGGNAKYLKLGIDTLVRELYVHEQDGARGARMLTSIRPYREADEPTSTTSTDLDSTSTRTQSQPTSTTPTTSTPLYRGDKVDVVGVRDAEDLDLDRALINADPPDGDLERQEGLVLEHLEGSKL